MIKNGINIRAAFKNAKKSDGIENAYRTLKGVVKFDNYPDNLTPWDPEGLIKYGWESFSDISNTLVISSLEVNESIKQMIEVE